MITIQIDSREKAKAIQKIISEFNTQEVKYYTSKLYVGDYMSLDNPRLVIDRKQNLQEICGNVCQQHKRFKAELIRAQEAGIQLIILCEHSNRIKTIDDVRSWENPRIKAWEKEIKKLAGFDNKYAVGSAINYLKQNKIRFRKSPMTGNQIADIMETMSEKYGVQWLFCDKVHTGQMIVELLGGVENE